MNMNYFYKVVMAVMILLLPTSAILSAGADRISPVMDVIRKYRCCDGVMSVRLGSFLLGIAKMIVPDEDGGELIKYFDRVAVLSADSADDMMKERIRSDLKKALNGYETLMEMREGDDDMTVYLSMQNEEVISEMVLVSDSEMALIFIAGDMPVSELQKIIAEVAEEQ